MAATPTRISELTQVIPQNLDQIPIARGSGAGGQTLKITVGSLVQELRDDIDDLTNRTITVRDSDTIDLTYDSSTRVLSADLQEELDLTSRKIFLPAEIEIPPGCIMPFAKNTVPPGWLACNGDIVPNTPSGLTNTITAPGLNFGKSGNFARLHSVLGTTYGSTPGTLPDLRGMFIRGWDAGKGVDSGRTFGSHQLDAFQGHKHNLYDPQHNHGITDPQHNHGITDPQHNHGITDPKHGHTGSTNETGEHTHNMDYKKTISAPGGGSDNLVNGTAPFNFNDLFMDKAGKHSHTVTVDANSTGITVNNNSTGITVNNNSTGITVNNNLTNVKVLSPTGDTATPGAGDSNGPGGGTPRVADETRPENFAFLYCIKY